MDVALGKELAEFVDYLHRGIRKFGIVPIRQKLAELYVVDTPRALRRRILTEVAAVYAVPPHRIVGSKKRGVVTEAKVMAIILMHKHLNITHAEIAVMFGCVPSNIGRRIKAFNGISGNGATLNVSANTFAKIYGGKTFMPRFKDIDAKIKEYRDQWAKK